MFLRDQPVLLQRFVDLDIAPQHFGQKFRQLDAPLLGLTGEICPHALFDGGGHQYPGAGRDVMETANPLAEIDLGRHAVVFDRLIAHSASLYCRLSAWSLCGPISSGSWSRGG